MNIAGMQANNIRQINPPASCDGGLYSKMAASPDVTYTFNTGTHFRIRLKKSKTSHSPFCFNTASLIIMTCKSSNHRTYYSVPAYPGSFQTLTHLYWRSHTSWYYLFFLHLISTLIFANLSGNFSSMRLKQKFQYGSAQVLALALSPAYGISRINTHCQHKITFLQFPPIPTSSSQTYKTNEYNTRQKLSF